MPRLLMIATVPETLQAFLRPFMKHFSARGWTVDAMAKDVSSCAKVVEACRRVWDVDWGRNPLYPSNLLRTPQVVRDIVKCEDYDLVHVHTPVGAFVSRFALRRLRRRGRPKVIYTAHGFHFFQGGRPTRNFLFRTLEKIAGTWTDYLVVINEEDHQAAQHSRLVAPGHAVYMPGIGIDTTRWSPEKVPPDEVEQVRASLGLAPGKPLFLMVAEFIRRKHHADALRAFARLSRADAHLALAGEGSLLEPMRALAADLNVADRMHFLGYRRDIPALVRAATALLLVSEQEGLPVSVMEALSLETPVIGTDIRGTRELLAGGCGLVVPVGGVEALANAMERILRDPEEARTMGRRGRAKVKERYDLDSIIKMHEALYARALADKPVGDGPSWL